MKRAKERASGRIGEPEPSAPRPKRQSKLLAPLAKPASPLTQALAPGLYVIATPIGNLSDMSPRALDILARADLVAVEDTRVTGKLLSLMGLSCTMVSYTEHNDDRRTPELLGQLAAGKVIALVSDAGTPLISDPGQRLVAAAAAQGRRIVPVPGPSAVIAALSVAGLSTERFMFAGFLPARAKARRESLSELGAIKTTLIFYEAPHRLIECLQDMAEMLGPRPAIVARELTKLYEEIRRGSLVELFEAARHQPDPKGEIVIVIGPPVAASADVADGFDLDRALAEAMAKYSLKDAVAAVADAHGLNRRAVYARAIALKEPLKNS